MLLYTNLWHSQICSTIYKPDTLSYKRMQQYWKSFRNIQMKDQGHGISQHKLDRTLTWRTKKEENIIQVLTTCMARRIGNDQSMFLITYELRESDEIIT